MPPQDNVALIAVLEALEPPFADSGAGGGGSRRQLVCVANTHIHSNPELNDVKLWQVGWEGCQMPCKVSSTSSQTRHAL